MNTIAAISTANSAGGLGVIRIAGEDAVSIAQRVFHAKDGTPLTTVKGYHAKFGHMMQGETLLDQGVALVFRAPHSYTGEDVVELSCHGGLFVLNEVLQSVFAAGAVPAQGGEFTKRAYLNGKMDLTSAESVMHLISAKGKQDATASLHAMEGNLYQKIKAILNQLLDCSASMAAWVDYPDDEIPDLAEAELSALLTSARAQLSELLQNYQQGQTILEGIDTVIVGRPNAGKSTLMNLLSGHEKSIVTEVAGTTRDVVEETVRLGNLVLRLSDTAGLRQSKDTVEAIGILRAYHKLKQASLILAIFDASQPLSADDLALCKLCKHRPAIAVINKSDLPLRIETQAITTGFSHSLIISAGQGQGLVELAQCVEEVVGATSFDPTAPLLASQRQRSCTVQALEAIEQAQKALQMGITYDAINVCIDDAISHLLSLTGEKVTDSVVEQVFANFCVGK